MSSKMPDVAKKTRRKPLDLIERGLLVAVAVFISVAAFFELPVWMALPTAFFFIMSAGLLLVSGVASETRTRIRVFARWLALLVSRNWPIPIASVLWIAAAVWSWRLIRPLTDPTNTLTIEWLKIVGPAGAAFFIAAGLVYTHKSSENARKALELQIQSTQRQEDRLREERDDIRRSEQNERFFKAIQLLGEKGNEGAHIGALFALEQLANESDYHYHQVVESICAFVRSRSAELMPKPKGESIDWREALPAPHDIQVAISVLARRRNTLGNGEQRGLDLRDSYLVGIELHGGDFQLANFDSAVFSNSQFRDTNFARAKFTDSILRHASFFDCIFLASDFMGTKMQHAAIAFMGRVADPSRRVAIESISGVEPNIQRVFYLESSSPAASLVNAGRCLDDSQWINAEVDSLSIDDFGFLEESLEPLDLSRMALISKSQWNAIKKPDKVIPPFHLELRP